MKPRILTCQAVACQATTNASRFMCRPHWLLLTDEQCAALHQAYRFGQEADGRPSRAYTVAALEAIAWVAEREGRTKEALDARQRADVWRRRSTRETGT